MNDFFFYFSFTSSLFANTLFLTWSNGFLFVFTSRKIAWGKVCVLLKTISVNASLVCIHHHDILKEILSKCFVKSSMEEELLYFCLLKSCIAFPKYMMKNYVYNENCFLLLTSTFCLFVHSISINFVIRFF